MTRVLPAIRAFHGATRESPHETETEKESTALDGRGLFNDLVGNRHRVRRRSLGFFCLLGAAPQHKASQYGDKTEFLVHGILLWY